MWEKEEMNCVGEETTTSEQKVPTISSTVVTCVCFSVYVFDIEAAMCKARRFIPLEKEVFV